MAVTLGKPKQGQKINVGGVPRVNLLPNSVGEKRAQSRVFRDWGLRIVLAAVLVALASAGMFAWQQVTAMQLQNVQSEGRNLLAQIAAKGEIQQLMTKERDLSSFRAEALGPELDWESNLRLIVDQFPKGANLCAYELHLGAAKAAVPEENAGLSGSIVICGPYPSAAPLLVDIKKVESVMSATVRDGKYDGELKTYAHTIDLVLDQSLYTGEHTEEASR